MPERLKANRAPLLFATDLILTELALVLAGLLRPFLPLGLPLTATQSQAGPLVFLAVALIWSAVFLLLSTYEPRASRAVDEGQRVLLAVSLASLVLAAVLFLTLGRMSRVQFLTFYGLDLILLLTVRAILHAGYRLTGWGRRSKHRVLILGAGPAGREACQMVGHHRWSGLEPVGFLDDDLPLHSLVEGYPVLGRTDEVGRMVEAHDVHEVVVALPLRALDRFFHLMEGLKRLPARVRIVPDYVKTALIRSHVEDFAGVPMITLQKPTLTPFERSMKRAFDLVAGTATLLVVAPLLGVTAVAVRLDSDGPAIFRQQRVGENGRLFWMYKFRTMVKDAEQQQLQAIGKRDGKPIFEKLPNDPRVTRVGRLLRRASLDELPQLVNVIRGEMSIVGPRPELPWLVELTYEPWQWQRFSVPQGITGWWQINGRSDKPMYLHTEEDLYYIQNYSLLLDVQIMWWTVSAVLKRRGAY